MVRRWDRPDMAYGGQRDWPFQGRIWLKPVRADALNMVLTNLSLSSISCVAMLGCDVPPPVLSSSFPTPEPQGHRRLARLLHPRLRPPPRHRPGLPGHCRLAQGRRGPGSRHPDDCVVHVRLHSPLREGPEHESAEVSGCLPRRPCVCDFRADHGLLIT